MRIIRTVLASVLALTIGGSVFQLDPANAFAPVKCSATDITPDGRVFPEPELSATFVTFPEFECGIRYLEAQFPGLIDVTVLGRSKGARPIYDVLLTDESVTDKKRKLLVISSIHGNEIAGKEGAVRNIEDLVDPRFDANEQWVQDTLDQFVIHFVFPNPDGWAKGDVTANLAPGTYTRGNETGRDLNRQFPVEGYIYNPNGTLKEPESQVIMKELFGGPNAEDWYLGTDNHGQGPDEFGAAGLQIVGQFHYQKSEQLAQFADNISVAMAKVGVLEQLEALGDLTGQEMGAYHWGTLYDMLGYSASGSLIDYYNTVKKVSGTGFATELTVSQQYADAAYPILLNQIWVDTIRAINNTMFQEALKDDHFVFPVGGRAAYVYDPEVITDDDANGPGYVPANQDEARFPQEPYRVSRMKFFSDLNRFADNPLKLVKAEELLEGAVNLNHFDSLVLANDAMPEPVNETAYYDLIKGWVEDGGNLIVTDAAAPALAKLGLVPDSAIDSHNEYVGFVDFGDRSNPLNAGLRGVASQTYDSVPIGYAFPPAGNNCPNWTVDSAAWEADGGITAGTNGEGLTIYGEKPLGEGRVRFLGALLPDPTEEFFHPFGLQNYAVTYTGYTLLQNMLNWTNPSATAAPAGAI